jgi:hypothetical protein
MADQQSSIDLTVDASGNVTYDFAGHVKAQGLDLTLGPLGVPFDVHAAIRWLDAAGIDMGHLYANLDANNQILQMFLEAQGNGANRIQGDLFLRAITGDITVPGFSVTELSLRNKPSASAGNRKRIFAGLYLLWNDLNQSDYLIANFRDGAVVDVVNTVTETDLIGAQGTGQSIFANMLGPATTARVSLTGDFLNNTAGATISRIRVYYGGTLMFDSGTAQLSMVQSATRRRWRIEFELANQGATNAQSLDGTFTMTRAGADTGGTGFGGLQDLLGNGAIQKTIASFGGTAAVDSTLSQNLRVTVAHTSSSPSLSWRKQHAAILLA